MSFFFFNQTLEITEERINKLENRSEENTCSEGSRGKKSKKDKNGHQV